MDLKGAKIRNFYEVCNPIEGEQKENLKINIPFYQRPYQWEKERISLLINDYFDNLTFQENDKYFIGSLVTTIKENDFHNLIDGQQRITTIYLINFVKYILLKDYLVDDIAKGGTSRLDKLYDDAVISEKNIFCDTHPLDEFDGLLKDEIQEIEDLKGEEKEEACDNLAYKFKEKLGIPVINKDNMEDYLSNSKLINEEFISTKKLCLQYSRAIFNEKLKKALSNVKIDRTSKEGPNLIVLSKKDEKEDPVISQYLSALEIIFSEFKSRVPKKDEKNRDLNSSKQSLTMINEISNFLENINFCLIQTGNEKDAYTLFEVLNDRALKLGPLDLIKNMFYKEYCQKNPTKSEKLIEKDLEILEKIWGIDTFNDSKEAWKKDLVLYFGTVYLTGNTKISDKKKSDFKEELKKYLSSKEDEMSFEAIKKEFYVFNFIMIMIDEFKLRSRNGKSVSLQMENTNESIILRTVNLLNVNKYNGILLSIVFLILKDYFSGRKEFDTDSFRVYLKDLINEKDNTISNFSYKLWRLAMLSKDYIIPKKYGDRIIDSAKKYNITSLNIEYLEKEISESKKEFIEWIKNWNYKNDDYKLRLLFLKLISSSQEGNTLRFNDLKSKFDNTNAIHMDHLEPSKIDETYPGNYFNPSDEHEDREKYVDELGNFLLLKSDKNIQKSNKPLSKSYEYFEKMGLKNHWLLDELKELLKNNSKSVNEIDVPLEKFFYERKVKLISYFYSIICNIESVDSNKEVKIEEITL